MTQQHATIRVEEAGDLELIAARELCRSVTGNVDGMAADAAIWLSRVREVAEILGACECEACL